MKGEVLKGKKKKLLSLKGGKKRNGKRDKLCNDTDLRPAIHKKG